VLFGNPQLLVCVSAARSVRANANLHNVPLLADSDFNFHRLGLTSWVKRQLGPHSMCGRQLMLRQSVQMQDGLESPHSVAQKRSHYGVHLKYRGLVRISMDPGNTITVNHSSR
jgi:hypothetical protein